MKDRQEKEMLDEIAFRNAIAMFRAASGKKGAIPELGIFWIDDSGTMFSESISLRDAVDYGEFKIFDGSHFELWPNAVRANPKWRDREYEEIPRGRVVYKKDPKKPEFIVYLPRKLGKYKKKVIDRFNLPSRHVRFDMSDEHYRI
jgi:hypothetical protein